MFEKSHQWNLYGNEICDKNIAEKQEMSVMYKKCFVDACKIKCLVCLNVLRFGASITRILLHSITKM